VTWSFLLEQTDHQTVTLTQRRETLDGISDLSRNLTDAHNGRAAGIHRNHARRDEGDAPRHQDDSPCRERNVIDVATRQTTADGIHR
jgi:hypothetical protein